MKSVKITISWWIILLLVLKEIILATLFYMLSKNGEYPQRENEKLSKNSRANVDFSDCGSSSYAIVKLDGRSTRGASTILFLPWRDIERIKRGRSGQDRVEGGERGRRYRLEFVRSVASSCQRLEKQGPGAKWLWWSSLKRKREDAWPGRWWRKKDGKIGEGGQTEFSLSYVGQKFLGTQSRIIHMQ